jgi:hypothetical protein
MLASAGVSLSFILAACGPSEPAQSEPKATATPSASTPPTAPSSSQAVTPAAPAVHYLNVTDVKRFDDEVAIANEPAQIKQATPVWTGVRSHDLGYMITLLPQAWNVVKIARVAAKPVPNATSQGNVLVSFSSKAQGGDPYLGWIPEEALVAVGSAQPAPAPPACAAGQLSVLGKCVKQCFAPNDCAASEGCVPYAAAGTSPLDDIPAACAKLGSAPQHGNFFPKDGQCTTGRSLVLDANGYLVCKKSCEKDDDCGKGKTCATKTKKPNRVDDVRVCAE